jgi:hypothetical protein
LTQSQCGIKTFYNNDVSSADVDDIVSDGDDIDVPINEVDVWIDPLDATQV